MAVAEALNDPPRTGLVNEYAVAGDPAPGDTVAGAGPKGNVKVSVTTVYGPVPVACTPGATEMPLPETEG